MIHFTVEGRIKPKERPRRGRYGKFYTPSATLESENLIGIYAKKAGLKPTKSEVNIYAVFHGSYGNCDLDNLIKTLLDGFKDFFNDRQVVGIKAFKKKSKVHLTEIAIWI